MAKSPQQPPQKAPHPEARIFPLATRFQKMAQREGGVARDKAVEQAQAAIEEAKPKYDEWLETEMKAFAALIKKAQTGKAEAGWIATANFQSRELRDSASPLGFPLLAFVASSLCEVLDAIEAGGECNMEAITCHLDALMLARQKSYRHLKPESVPDLTKGLQRVVKHVAI